MVVPGRAQTCANGGRKWDESHASPLARAYPGVYAGYQLWQDQEASPGIQKAEDQAGEEAEKHETPSQEKSRMSLRFRKSIRLGKFLRLNLGKSGIGISAGIKGAHIGLGSRGPYVSAGIPGTGLSVQKQLGKGAARAGRPAAVGVFLLGAILLFVLALFFLALIRH
jgi:hypothetical protein